MRVDKKFQKVIKRCNIEKRKLLRIIVNVKWITHKIAINTSSRNLDKETSRDEEHRVQ